MSDHEQRRKSQTGRLFCLSTMLALAYSAANAQDSITPGTDASNDSDLQADRAVEEIVVVGVDLGSGAARSNQTISVELIEDMPSLMAPLSIIDRLPGVNVAASDAYGSDDYTTSFDIRGFGREQIGFVVDGIPIGSTAFNSGSRPNRWIETENLQSVSVYQGAANVGAPTTQSLGGSVVYTSRGPEDEFGGHMTFTGGDNDMKRYFLRLDSGAILGGNTFAYASYSNTNYDHWMDYGAKAKNKREHAELAIRHELGNGNSLALKYTYNFRYNNNYDSVTTEDWLDDPWSDGIHGPWTGNPLVDAYNTEGWNAPTKDELISLVGNFRLPFDFDATVVGYHHSKPYSPGWWPWECTMHSGDPFSPTFGPTVCERDENGVATVATMYISHYPMQRNGLTLTLDKRIGNHTISFGGWHEHLNRHNSRTYHEILDPKAGPDWAPTVYWWEYQRDFNTDTIMAFAADSISLFDGRATLNAGVTATKVSIDYTNRLAAEPQVNYYESDYVVAPRIGMQYYITPDLEVYASYSRNFKMLQDSDLQERDVTNVDTETADSIDIGMRYQNDWLRATISAYSIDFGNRIVDFVFTVPPEEQGNRAYEADGVQINAGGQESVGVEVAADFRMTDYLSLYLSAARNSGDGIDVVSIETDPLGNLVSTNWVASTREDFSFFGELTFRRDKLRIGLNATYEDEREGDLEGSTPAPSYWLWGAQARYDLFQDRDGLFKSLSMSLNVHNLFDEPYLSGVARLGRWFVGAPRAAVFTVSTEF